MHNKDKYPEIWAQLEKAQTELEPLMAKRKTFTDQIDAVGAEIGALQQKKNDLNDQAMKDADKIAELRDTIARMAKAMGAKSASGV